MADRMLVLLIGGYAGALLLGAYELQRPPAIPDFEPGPAAQAVPPVELPPDTIKDMAAFDAINERPLFKRERRPDAADTGAGPTDSNRPAQQVDDIGGMRLAAVLKGPQNLTILIEDRNGDTRIMHEGDKLGKWQIERILDDRVTVVSNGRKETLLVHRFDLPVTRKNVRAQARSPDQQSAPRPARRITPRSPMTERRADAGQDKP